MTHKSLFKLLCVLTLTVTSCKKELTGLELNEEFTLKYGQTAIVTDKQTEQNIHVKFAELLEDSRCPEGAQCIWAGQVTLELILNNKEKIKIVPISVYNSIPVPGGPTKLDTSGIMEYNNYKFLLLKVDPYPKLDIKVSKKKYSATLKILK